jgi:hypothetical protein
MLSYLAQPHNSTPRAALNVDSQNCHASSTAHRSSCQFRTSAFPCAQPCCKAPVTHPQQAPCSTRGGSYKRLGTPELCFWHITRPSGQHGRIKPHNGPLLLPITCPVQCSLVYCMSCTAAQLKVIKACSREELNGLSLQPPPVPELCLHSISDHQPLTARLAAVQVCGW